MAGRIFDIWIFFSFSPDPGFSWLDLFPSLQVLLSLFFKSFPLLGSSLLFAQITGIDAYRVVGQFRHYFPSLVSIEILGMELL